MSDKKRVLVTGSTQGIGKAIAKRLVLEGYEVIVHGSRDITKVNNARDEIGASMAVVADLSDLAETKALYSKTGAVDCLILNASVQFKSRWLDITDEEFEKQINVNLRSTLLLMQAYYPEMEKRGFGRIVTIGSVNQYRNHPELSVYGATKSAVMRLVENVAKYSAPHGVTVNNIAPGAIVTPRNDSIYEDDAKRALVESTIPLGRFGKSEEITGTVSLLLREESAYITGADIVIDGGMRL